MISDAIAGFGLGVEVTDIVIGVLVVITGALSAWEFVRFTQMEPE